MPAILTIEDLAVITSTLLVNPTALGELDEFSTHQNFVEAIAIAIAERCGGDVELASEWDGDQQTTSIRVHENDGLPSNTRNAWTIKPEINFAPTLDTPEDIEDNDRSNTEWTAHKAAISETMSKLAFGYDNHIRLNYQMSDWDGERDNPKTYNAAVEITAANASIMLVNTEDEDHAAEMWAEVNHGLPCTHLNDECQNGVLHIHREKDAFIIAKGDAGINFDRAGISEASYGQLGAIKVAT